MLSNLPKYPIYKKVSWDDFNDYYSFLNQFPTYSDFILSNLHIWKSQDVPNSYCDLNGNLAIRYADDELSSYSYSLLGKNDLYESVSTLLTDVGKLKGIPHDVVSNLDKGKFKIVGKRSQYEYVYKNSILTSLKGNKYEQRRREMNKFMQRYEGYQVKEIDLNDSMLTKMILKLFDDWINTYDSSSYDVALGEYNAFKNLVSNFSTIKANFLNLGLFYKGKLMSFEINEYFDNGYAYCHFVKHDREFRSSSPAIFYESCKILQEKGIDYMNFDHDVGLNGLRQYKKVWRPAFYLHKYNISALH